MRPGAAVPPANIYYLLCYAWEWLEALDLVEVGAVENDRLENLLSKALIEGTSNLLRRGLDRAYQEHCEDTRMPRGTIDVARTVKRQLRSRSMVACAVDDLSYDVLHNRLIFATLRQVLGAPIDPRIARDARRLVSRFPSVSWFAPTPAHFAGIRLHRNSHHYRFILNLCELLLRRLLPDGRGTGLQFYDIRESAQEMGRLFQAFVHNFLAREQARFRVKAETVRWDVGPSTEPQWLPEMRTDISLISPSRKVVIEVKYVANVFEASFGGAPKLRSDHLDQLFAYLKNLEARGGINGDATGVLLYGTAGQRLNCRYVLGGHEILVRSIDLAGEWPDIHAQLMSLSDELSGPTPSSAQLYVRGAPA